MKNKVIRVVVLGSSKVGKTMIMENLMGESKTVDHDVEGLSIILSLFISGLYHTIYLGVRSYDRRYLSYTCHL
jgi:GTPase SAR1 family protein